MVLHQLSGDMEITFQIRFCAYRIIISAETFVKTATHRRYGKVFTNIPTEMDKSSSTKQAISEYRNSDFQISGSAISSHKNIQEVCSTGTGGKQFGKAQRKDEDQQTWEKKTQKDPVSGNGTVACKKQGVPRDL